MTITAAAELEALQAVGRVVARVLADMRAAVRPGVTTAELDLIGARMLTRLGARSAPQLVYDFPGATCISVNDEVVHGVPGERVLARGDVVKLDVTAELDGFMADSACTLVVGGGDGPGARLAASARAAFYRALQVARPGTRLSRVGRAVETEVARRGFAVIPELSGHGIGRTIHEPPVVPNYHDRAARGVLAEGLVITIEPLISAGSGAVYLDRDRWTVRTRDGAPAAHYEHTIVITAGKPIILTAPS